MTYEIENFDRWKKDLRDEMKFRRISCSQKISDTQIWLKLIRLRYFFRLLLARSVEFQTKISCFFFRRPMIPQSEWRCSLTLIMDRETLTKRIDDTWTWPDNRLLIPMISSSLLTIIYSKMMIFSIDWQAWSQEESRVQFVQRFVVDVWVQQFQFTSSIILLMWRHSHFEKMSPYSEKRAHPREGSAFPKEEYPHLNETWEWWNVFADFHDGWRGTRHSFQRNLHTVMSVTCWISWKYLSNRAFFSSTLHNDWPINSPTHPTPKTRQSKTGKKKVGLRTLQFKHLQNWTVQDWTWPRYISSRSHLQDDERSWQRMCPGWRTSRSTFCVPTCWLSTDRYMHEIQDDTWRDLKWFSISSLLTIWINRKRSLTSMSTNLLERWWRVSRYSSLPYHISCRRFRSCFSSIVSLHDDAISFYQVNV